MRAKRWWRRKRVLLPLLAAAALTASTGVAFWRSGTSSIAVYNETGMRIPGMRLAACGQNHSFPEMPVDGSFRWRLAPVGSESEIELETAGEPVIRWRGGYVEPRGGYRITLRLWPDGQVELHTQLSVWQRWFRGAPAIDE